MALAASTSTVTFAALGGYLLVLLVWFLSRRRDVYGRTRPLGCLVGFILFFGLFVVALAILVAHTVF